MFYTLAFLRYFNLYASYELGTYVKYYNLKMIIYRKKIDPWYKSQCKNVESVLNLG